jgi:hypothetical protein
MRTARLDHNPLAGTPPVPMGSCVPQPFHVTTGNVRHPATERPGDTAPLPINVDWRLVLHRLGMTDTEVGAAVGRSRPQVGKWRRGTYAPPVDAKRELERLWNELIGGPLPGQHSPGATAAAIGASVPRKPGRPSKAAVAERIAARRAVVHRVAEPEGA